MSLDLTIHHVTGITIQDPHRTIGGGCAATLEIRLSTGQPIEIDIFADTMRALTRVEVEYDPEHLDDVQAALVREEAA